MYREKILKLLNREPSLTSKYILWSLTEEYRDGWLSFSVHKCTWRMSGKEPWQTAELQLGDLNRTILFTCWVKEWDILYIHSVNTVGSNHKPAATGVHLLGEAQGKRCWAVLLRFLILCKNWNKTRTHLLNSSVGYAGSKNSFSSSLLLSKSQHSCICFRTVNEVMCVSMK